MVDDVGLGGVHRLCVVGSLGEKRLRSHRLLKVGGGGECGEKRGWGAYSSQALREAWTRDTGYGPSWGSASALLCD